ncbi:MAG: AbrB/MazE/SpoVT family DNA-binding domain-containing protein [Candidatus Dormibacteria bacterium]
MAAELDRKRVKLNASGGSRAVIVPKAWLRRFGAQDSAEIELVLTEEGIELQPIRPSADSVESEPEFATFLNFLTKTAFAHPETLTDASEFYQRDRELLGLSD